MVFHTPSTEQLTVLLLSRHSIGGYPPIGNQRPYMVFKIQNREWSVKCENQIEVC